MLQSDTRYYRRRAANEREMALKAAGPKAGDIHLELARRYDVLGREPAAPGLLRAVA
jgi:hypothetical protein